MSENIPLLKPYHVKTKRYMQGYLQDDPFNDTREQISANSYLHFAKGMWKNIHIVIDNDGIDIIKVDSSFKGISKSCCDADADAGIFTLCCDVARLFAFIGLSIGSLVILPIYGIGVYKKNKIITKNKKMNAYYQLVNEIIKVSQGFYLTRNEKRGLSKEQKLYEIEINDLNNKIQEATFDYPNETTKQTMVQKIISLKQSINNIKEKIKIIQYKLNNDGLSSDIIKELYNEWQRMNDFTN